MVAIKMMKDRYQWKCEIQARQEYELDSCVVKLVGWHAPQGEDTLNGRTWCSNPSNIVIISYSILEHTSSSVLYHRT